MRQARMLVSGGTVVSLDPRVGDLETANVLIEDGRIVAVGRDVTAEDAELVDATGTIVIPGFVDSHRHTWQAAIRNIASDWSLFHYVSGIHKGLSRYFRPQDTYVGTLIGRLEALESGITTMLDWSHNINSPDHADAAVAALRESGARSIFAHGGGAPEWQVPGSPVPHPTDARRVREQHFSSADDLVTMMLALRGPQLTVKEIVRDDWRLARELDLRITVHVGDGDFGRGRPVAWMHEERLMNDRTTYVHCNSIADDEIAMIAATGGTASVAADVEMQMGHGWPATGRLLDAGIRPSLSIDVCSSNGGDMFGAMRTTIGVQRATDNAALADAGLSLADGQHLRLTCRDVLEFATIEGARACGIDDRTGSIAPGKDADIVLIRTDSLAMTPLINPVGALVYNGHPGMVDTAIVRGEVVLRGGRLVGVDLPRLRRLAQESVEHLVGCARRDPRLADIELGGRWIPHVEPVDLPARDAAGASTR